jgi:hypothetical protein
MTVTEEEIATKITEFKPMYAQYKPMAAMFLKDMSITSEMEVAGEILESSVFKKIGPNKVSWTFSGEQLIDMVDGIVNDPALPKKVAKLAGAFNEGPKSDKVMPALKEFITPFFADLYGGAASPKLVIKPGAASTCFHSSGTTGHRPSRHWHSPSSLAVYEDSLAGWFEPFLLKEETTDLIVDSRESDGRWAMVSLTPPADAVPHSSLAHMMATLLRRFGTKDSLFVGTLDSRGDWVLDTDRLLFALRRSLCGNRPLVLMGTAFNFVHFLDLAEQRNLRYRLAAGSRLMETGGYKGRSREMSPELLHSELGRRLGLPGSHVITEYGMCELSSQAYSHAAGTPPNRHFRFPPWARTRVVSPETGDEAGEGEIGTLAVYDLANVWSVMAVQTGDLAIRTGDSFRLVGRVPQSEPRGCSLLAA